MDEPTEDSRTEVEVLRERLEIAEDTIRAIHAGEVDALVVQGSQGKQVYVLEGADRPYRLFVEYMRQGAVRLTREGVIFYANPHVAVLLEKPESVVLGSNLLDYVAPRHHERVAELLRSEEPASIEIQLVRESGRVVHVQFAVSAPAGTTLIGVLTDLTEQRRRKVAMARAEALRKSGRTLRRALMARRHAEESLREANQRKDEFLATLSHELRNPLASIRNALQLLKLEGVTRPETQQARDIIERQVEQTVRLIDDLMDVSRITRGTLDLRFETFTVADLLQDVQQASRHVIEEHGHEFLLLAPEREVHIRGDRVRLCQVFGNLITNAAKYTPKGGHLELRAVIQDPELVVAVSDNGVGIPSDQLAEIFKPFARVDTSIERGQGGLGIGLSLSERIVALHGGSVTARSDGAGQGATFVVRMPVVTEPGAETAPSPGRETAADPCPSRKILVADDNDDAAESLAMLLRTLGHQAVTANDGLEALEFAQTGEFDLALLDIGMPRLNGYDLAAQIREQPWGRDILLVALTGWGQESDKRRALESGFNNPLPKPVDAEQLIAILARPRQLSSV